jgi:hypothetical protein
MNLKNANKSGKNLKLTPGMLFVRWLISTPSAALSGNRGRIANRVGLSLVNLALIVSLEVVLPTKRAIAEEVLNLPVPPPSSVTRITPSPPRWFGALELTTSEVGTGSNARVNVNPSTLTRPQVEPSVSSNLTNPAQLVAGFADSQNDPVAFDSAPGVSLSTDRGKTWVSPAGGPILPNPPGFIWGSRILATHLAAGDSAVAWGLGNTVYFSTLGFHNNQTPPNIDCSSGGLYVYRSDDGGNTWSLPANGPAIPNTQTVFRDKEYIAVDSNPSSPFAGRVYMVWDDDIYSGCPQFFDGPQKNFITRTISFSFSSDGGATWAAPAVLASGCLVAAVPAVAVSGDLYVVWFDCNSGIRQMVRKSSTGGISFGPAVAAASGLTEAPSPLIGSNFRVGSFPAIATDPTDASFVYITWSSDNGPSQTDVFVTRSLNAGATWSAPVRVNDDPPGNPRDQFFPWIAVDTDGTVRVMWGDDRLDLLNPGGKFYDIFMAESVDHGASFGPNIRVTTESSNPDFDGFNGMFIGDYFGLSASGVAVWGDTRNGNQDIFGNIGAQAATNLVSAVLPSSRSVQVGAPATAFATIINAGSNTATSCGISNRSFIPANFNYQTTDPATNAVIGTPNTPVDIAAGAFQTYIFAFTPTAPFAPTEAQMSFDCTNTDPAPITTGLNTLLLSASATPVPDIVALAATLSNDGIVNVPGANGTGAFAVATVNVGASGSITASADTGSATLPMNISLCQTDPASGQCISAISPAVTTTINANATPTFGIFVQGVGIVSFDPAASRIFVRFKDGGGVTRGSTSVAVRTQ